ncbi:hypothetical protein [Zobellia barbeyronii]|uniref:Uncharacterized protein n=1 Tax=Zobellia barbeyronii TaxID=2748009 RepID=A0ABS5WDJ2_9FLAO|nr:hypothetical protein [Zobellia barbeyronii]MBT2161478.1 hypothetical protein [Zobellia barbeyronii]
MNKSLRNSILVSYVLGLPIGLLTIIATIYLPLFFTGEGLFSFAIIAGYGWPTLGLALSFLVALGIGAKVAYDHLHHGKSLLFSSFMYSAVVNGIIWATFCFILLFSQEDNYPMMIPAVLALLFCTVVTTFTLGLLITFIISRIRQNGS